MKKNLITPKSLTLIVGLSFILSACQSTKHLSEGTQHATITAHTTQPTASTTKTSIQNNDQTNPSFAITGKIGITTITTDGKKGGSAFYAWGQKDGRFSIDLTGALGLGATSIRYDGKAATLISEKTGTIYANSPEELLAKTTGWHAPISQLPHWIIGQIAPNDINSKKNNNQLIQSQHGAWQATFDYDTDNSPMPNRLRIQHQDGHRFVITIQHQPTP